MTDTILAAGIQLRADNLAIAKTVVVLTSPKGGVGKTTLARNLLVRAGQTGLKVVGVDLDRQKTLTRWGLRRRKTREAFPDFIDVPVKDFDIDDWRAALEATSDYDLAVIDTPPSVEDHKVPVNRLTESASFVIVPTGYMTDDLDSVIPWMRGLTERRIRAAFCLNKANRRTNSFRKAQGKLMKTGALCPVEVPLLEDIHVTADKGLTVLDIERAKGIDAFEFIWDFTKREVGL
jgi:chromosome partitioning protein